MRSLAFTLLDRLDQSHVTISLRQRCLAFQILWFDADPDGRLKSSPEALVFSSPEPVF
jgi:hypothetical protein